MQALSKLTTGVMYPIGPVWHSYTIQCNLIAVTLLQVTLTHSTYNFVPFVVGSVPNRSPDKERLVKRVEKLGGNSTHVDIIFLHTLFCSEKERKKVSGGNSRCFKSEVG